MAEKETGKAEPKKTNRRRPPNAGRKQEYGEATTTKGFRLPVSLYDRWKKLGKPEKTLFQKSIVEFWKKSLEKIEAKTTEENG